MAAVFCTQCGAMNSSEDAYCTQCGAPLETVEEAYTEPVTQKVQPTQQQYNPYAAPQQPVYAQQPQQQAYAAPVAYPAYGQAPQQPEKPKNRTGLIIGIIAAVAVVAVAIILFVFGGLGSSSSSGSAAPSNAASASAAASASTGSASAQAAPAPAASAQSATPSASSAASSASSASASNEYVLPDSNTRYYSKSELEKLSNLELYRARNEIYARYGRGFKNEDLREWFGSKSWYTERYSPSEFDSMASPLNDYERKNSDLMLEIEKSRNSPYV